MSGGQPYPAFLFLKDTCLKEFMKKVEFEVSIRITPQMIQYTRNARTKHHEELDKKKIKKGKRGELFSVSSKRKGRGRSQSTPQPVLRPRRTLRRSQPTRERTPESGESSDESPVRSPTPPPPSAPSLHDPAAAGLLVEFSKSYESPPHNQINTSSSSGETPPTPMSKTALLVAAAVGPLAPGFKFPKTKKGLINSWLKSPESSPTAQPEEMMLRGQGFGATKKRWLRQAISEECDSPNSRPGEYLITKIV
ncbi:positive regulation of histone H3-K4 trimethylation [Homalodisca vitripennis]|nr:positive regulation of histone H3-K4 trimethylation [Homalodisca vitripennis]